jgi:hypothetical protein
VQATAPVAPALSCKRARPTVRRRIAVDNRHVSTELVIGLAGLALTAGALYVGLQGHRERTRERKARARFNVTVRTVDADENGIRWTDADTQHTRIGLGVKNIGDRAAGETLVNVVVPRSLPFARWAGPSGEEMPDGKVTVDTPELLPDAEGNETIPSKFLASTFDRVGRRPHYEKFVQFPVELPPRDSGLRQTTVPGRVRVQADELPDDVGEYVVNYTVHVVRRG